MGKINFLIMIQKGVIPVYRKHTRDPPNRKKEKEIFLK